MNAIAINKAATEEAEDRGIHGNGEWGAAGPQMTNHELGDTPPREVRTGGDSAKPALSYIAMIAKAILSSPSQKLNLTSIYADIERHFPYYRSRGQGWKNSVRHNLSLNDCFVKLGRCEDGKGSYWGIHPAHLPDFLRGDFRQHRKASRSRRQGIHSRLLGGDPRCFGSGLYLAPYPQCPFQPRWASPTLLHPGPTPWTLDTSPGDAGRWGCERSPWRLQDYGVVDPGDAGRWGCERSPWRLQDYGVVDAAMAGVGVGVGYHLAINTKFYLAG
ncbi:hypothetical protein JZ751_005857 [Albula glossodonta]|uniref:Fork-head domain-containing protein n=1 Tax=Albula glossodonta TaxID=121402 RepID=A0A8T2P540_9TELE|nr:hypothetical protein JZ751_005857 [Albula glossodonta]